MTPSKEIDDKTFNYVNEVLASSTLMLSKMKIIRASSKIRFQREIIEYLEENPGHIVAAEPLEIKTDEGSAYVAVIIKYANVEA